VKFPKLMANSGFTLEFTTSH